MSDTLNQRIEQRLHWIDQGRMDIDLPSLAADVRAALRQGAQRCEYCDGTGDVHALDGEWRGVCSCPTSQGAQPAEKVADIWFAIPNEFRSGLSPHKNGELGTAVFRLAQAYRNALTPQPEVPTPPAQPDPNAPAEVFLQLYGDSSADEGPVDYQSDEVTWCWHRIHDSDVRYVQARALCCRLPLHPPERRAMTKYEISERVERLKFEIRQAFIDYGSVCKAGAGDIHGITTRGVQLIDELGALAQKQAPRRRVNVIELHCDSSGNPFMSCQKDRYAPPTPEQADDDHPPMRDCACAACQDYFDEDCQGRKIAAPAAPAAAREQQQWAVSADGRNLIANSFQHDAMLTISGDFETPEERIAYAEDIARRLAGIPQQGTKEGGNG